METAYPIAYLRHKYLSFDRAALSIASSPMLYGLSTYSVIPVFWDEVNSQLNIYRLADHFKRLRNSAKILDFEDFLEKWDSASFNKVVVKLLRENNIKEDCLIRATVFVDGLISGARMLDIPNELAIFVYPMNQLMPPSGGRLMTASWRRTPDDSIPARAKVNGNYVNAALMKNEALRHGFDDAIALNHQGQLTESTISNIFLVKDNRLITPSANQDILEGITRDSIFKIASDQGLDYQQRAIDRSELYLADEIFLCGSSMSIAPIIEVDNRAVGDGQVGRLTKLLLDQYLSVAHAKLPDKYAWLSKVY